jgi:O-antigen/teichoic acid export membrane protein
MKGTDPRFSFFRQSGWMITATTLSGMLMAAVHPVVASMPKHEYGVFFSLLRLFVLLSIPAAGLQTVFARQAAAAVTDQAQRELAGSIRAVLWGTFLLWSGIVIITVIFRSELLALLQITNPAALWVTLLLVLAALWLPAMHGVLQGLQNFLLLGWSIIFNGLGRLTAIAIIVLLLGGWAAGAMAGALLGVMGALLLCFPAIRKFLQIHPAPFDWRNWLGRVFPLTLGVGASLFVMNADMLVVQSHFPGEVTPFYAAAAMIGVALVLFTTPLAAVMFPKIVQSIARAEKTDALILAFSGTAILGGSGALFCTLFPELPLRILFFTKPEFLQSAPLVPWFMWALLPVTLANVLISNMLARDYFSAVPWLVLVAIGYGAALLLLVRDVQTWEPFAAFRLVIQTLGVFSLLLLLTAAAFTWQMRLGSARGRLPLKAPFNSRSRGNETL